MGMTYPELDARLRGFIEAQQIFFTGTAPTGAEGHVNVSPKGLGGFRIFGPREVAYLDYTGSGAETIAHLRQNGRIVLMFCAFEGPPNILRLHGTGRVIEPGDAGFESLVGRFRASGAEIHAGLRAIIHIDVERISGSCGYGVPKYEYLRQRPQLPAWAERKGPEGLAAYQRQKNAESIDGLPALSRAATL